MGYLCPGTGTKKGQFHVFPNPLTSPALSYSPPRCLGSQLLLGCPSLTLGSFTLYSVNSFLCSAWGEFFPLLSPRPPPYGVALHFLKGL